MIIKIKNYLTLSNNNLKLIFDLIKLKKCKDKKVFATKF